MPGEHFEPCAASDCRPRVRWLRSRHFAALCSIKRVHVGKILGPSRPQFRRNQFGVGNKEAGGFFKKLGQRSAIGTPTPAIVPRSNGRAGGKGAARPAKWPAGAESCALAAPPADKATGSASAGAT
jgi:hypothetical protein